MPWQGAALQDHPPCLAWLWQSCALTSAWWQRAPLDPACIMLQHVTSAPESRALLGEAVISLPHKVPDIVSELSDYFMASRCFQCASKHQRSAYLSALLSVPFACQPFAATPHSVSNLMCVDAHYTLRAA